MISFSTVLSCAVRSQNPLHSRYIEYYLQTKLTTQGDIQNMMKYKGLKKQLKNHFASKMDVTPVDLEIGFIEMNDFGSETHLIQIVDEQSFAHGVSIQAKFQENAMKLSISNVMQNVYQLTGAIDLWLVHRNEWNEQRIHDWRMLTPNENGQSYFDMNNEIGFSAGEKATKVQMFDANMALPVPHTYSDVSNDVNSVPGSVRNIKMKSGEYDKYVSAVPVRERRKKRKEKRKKRRKYRSFPAPPVVISEQKNDAQLSMANQEGHQIMRIIPQPLPTVNGGYISDGSIGSNSS